VPVHAEYEFKPLGLTLPYAHCFQPCKYNLPILVTPQRKVNFGATIFSRKVLLR